MNSKERVKNIIRRRQTDRIPYSFDMTSVIVEGIARHYGIGPSSVSEFIGDDLKYAWAGNPSGYKPAVLNEKMYSDEFGVLWGRAKEMRDIGDCGKIMASPLQIPSLDGYAFPEGKAPGRFDYAYEDEYKSSDRYLVAGIMGLFDSSWYLRGIENFLTDFINEAAFVERLMDRVLEYILGVIGQVPSHIDGIRFCEDWGQQRGLLMGPKYWRKYLKPRLKVMYEYTKKRGFDVMIHSCGDIQEILPDLIEIGVEVVNPVQPEVMDVERIKKEYGRDLVLYGGMGSQSTLPNGTPKDVVAEAKRRLEILGKNGGYILGPAGAMSTDSKMENVIALVEFVRNGYRE